MGKWGLTGVVLLLQDGADFFDEGGELEEGVAGAEGFDGEPASIADAADDLGEAGEVDGGFAAVDPDGFLDLPGDGVGNQGFDFGVGVALAEGADVEDDSKPGGVDGFE